MKKLTLLTMMLFALFVVSCNGKDEPKKKTFKFDRYAKVNLSPDMNGWKTTPQGQKAPANDNHLSALEIVKQTIMMRFQNKKAFGDEIVSRGFADEQRDFNPKAPKLKMYASDIINQIGNNPPYIIKSFLEAENVVLVRRENIDAPFDTIAYIPNSVLRIAEKQIKEAFTQKDYDKVYQLFEDAYTFLPITAEELREIRK